MAPIDEQPAEDAQTPAESRAAAIARWLSPEAWRVISDVAGGRIASPSAVQSDAATDATTRPTRPGRRERRASR